MLTLLQPSFVQSRSRRRGQALILAVLVMLFAVLLSSAFLVVIGNNGRQVGRETDKLEASRNADKGVAFVVAQLRASSNPDSWNPAANPANLPTSAAEADIYYSQLDKAMGWEGQRYVKYPNPLSSRQAPQFLVSSHLLGTQAGDNADGGDKRFMLRITVIGLSSKNPEAWSRRVLYKSTKWNGATFSYANFVTSFDPDTKKPIVSALANSGVTVSAAPTLNSEVTLPVYAARGQGNERVTYSPRIAEVGNTLMISDGQFQPVVGIVRGATLANDVYTIRIRVLQAGTVAGNFNLNAKVALVGSLFEAPTNLDEDGNGNGVPASPTEGVMDVQPIVGVGNSTNTLTTPLGNGAQFNEGLNVPATTTFAARPPAETTTGSGVYAGHNSLSSSGPLSVGDPTPTPINTPIGINFVSTTTGPAAAFVPQVAPSQNQFLRVSYNQNGAPVVSRSDSAVAPVIAPRSIKPAPIDLASYRARAIAGSQVVAPALPTGFYIPNADDVEKFNGQPLTANQLQRLWQRKSFPVAAGGNITYTGTNVPVATGINTNAARLCYGRPTIDTYLYPMSSGGLEAQGIRGWISPWEFLPRGAQIILTPPNPAALPPTPGTITIVSDPLSDSSPNAPDLNKALDATTRGFSQTFTPSQDGIIICAAGNVRVRGAWKEGPVTIVSGGNIYVEGNLSTRDGVDATTGNILPGKIALLAKKNVVLNPTQFVPRPLGTVDTSVGRSSFTAQAQSGGIQEAANRSFRAESFKLGDKVIVFKRGVKSDGWHEVTSFDNALNPTSIGLTPPLNTTNYPDSSDIKVKLACDPPIVLLQTANKANGAGADDIPATEHFIAGADGKEANTVELNPSLNPASAGVAYAYKFSVGGDTLARSVRFTDVNNNPAVVGVSFNQAAQKSVIKFTVRGGDDKDPANPDAAKEDDGVRQLNVRPGAPNAIDATLKPKAGEIKGQETLNLQDANQDGSPDPTGDAAITLDALNSFFLTRAGDADREKTRWRIEGVRDVSSNVTSTGNITTRRLAQGDMSFNVPANSKQANGEEAPNEPTKFRVPLTSSVIMFSGPLALGTTAPEDATPLYRVGSAFGFRGAVIAPATDEDQNSIKNAFYGVTPLWSVPVDATPDSKTPYTSGAAAGDFAFTRDGSGDYDDSLPAYYISALRFQRVDDTTSKTSIAAAANAPKINMNALVDATIYAEGGSWFVIPVPQTTLYNSTLGTDQNVEWRRPAYRIAINGNITQMMTPSATVDYDDEPDADGMVTGAMKRWTDSLAYQAVINNTPVWQTLSYRSTPLPAFAADNTGTPILDAQGNPTPAVLPTLPSSSDILYTYSN